MCRHREVTANVQPAEVVRGCRVRAKQAEIAALQQQLSKVSVISRSLPFADHLWTSRDNREQDYMTGRICRCICLQTLAVMLLTVLGVEAHRVPR